MPIFIMLGLYLGLFICTLLYLKKINRIKIKTQTKPRNTVKRYGNDNAKRRIK
jgi:uncharacterized membrane protein YciS (DUF1049 family)